MGGARTWIFRFLVLVGAGLIAYTFTQVWWSAYIVALKTTAINIYAHGIVSLMPVEYSSWIVGYDKVMPGWFTPFMWVYMVAAVALLLFSMFASGKKRIGIGKFGLSLPSAIVTVVGISFIAVAVTAVAVISANLPAFYNAPLNGTFLIDMGEADISEIDTGLTTAYYIAAGTGLFLVIVGLLRNVIIGKSKSST